MFQRLPFHKKGSLTCHVTVFFLLRPLTMFRPGYRSKSADRGRSVQGALPRVNAGEKKRNFPVSFMSLHLVQTEKRKARDKQQVPPLTKEKHLSISSWCAKASRPKRHGWCKRKRPSQELRWEFNNWTYCRGFASILSFSYIRPTFGAMGLSCRRKTRAGVFFIKTNLESVQW